jgi:hypothetical protein
VRSLLLLTLLSLPALAQVDGGLVETAESGDGYTPDESNSSEVLRFTGYLDVGFAKTTGDGSSFAPNDTRVPLDYGTDPFATMVNSRGDVASTDATGRFTNGFLPRSVGIGNRPSLLLNTLSADMRFQPRSVPLFVFARVQFMPRLLSTGDSTRVELQQAFARLTPFSSQEFAVSLGRFDSVFGIEYNENEANLRVNITPSLIARYTTGQGLGLKAFFRRQLPGIWSAISLNVAGTLNGTRIEALVPIDTSLIGLPVGSGRIGYELNLTRLQVKLGASGVYGPRNDQHSAGTTQAAWGVDARLNFYGVAIAGEMIHLYDQPSALQGKVTGITTGEIASGFEVLGGWVRLSYTLPWKTDVLTGVTLGARFDRRHAQFEGYTWVDTDRLTVFGRVDLWDQLALKAEWVVNAELPTTVYVNNNVFTASAVVSW